MKRIFLTTLLISLIGFLNLTAQERIYTPELSAPVDGAVDQMSDVVLDWNAVTGGGSGIIEYDIQLDTDPAFNNPINFKTEFLSAIQTENLLFGGTYYWHVRAIDGSDISEWSETWSFRVVRRVTLTNPNDASLQNDTTRIQWASMTGITEFEYQFDTVYFWESMSSGQFAKFFDVAVVDASHSWFVGLGGVIFFYDGMTWTEQESNLSTDLYNVNMLDANNGWAVGKGGKIIRFNGTSWEEQTSSTTSDLKDIHMLDVNNGWAVGKGGVVLHFDGSAWSTQFTAPKDLNGVFAYDATHVWAVGRTGLIIFYDGSSWVEQSTGGTIKEFLSVGFFTADHGWVVGKTGFMMQFDQGEWKNYTHTITSKDLNSINITGPDNAYAVGKSGTLLQFDGVDWSSQSSTTTTNLNGVSFVGNTGLIAGDGGTAISYNDQAFTSPMAVIRQVPGDQVSKKLSDLLFGTQYYWRMRAKSLWATSIWSGARSFNTRPTVTLDKPSNSASDQNLDQLLKWKNQFSEMVSYEIQIDDDPDYGSPMTMLTTEIEINAELLKFGFEYNWRVRAIHAFDVSEWSISWKFTTINTVILDSPENNETDVKLSPLLTWEEQTGIIEYQVQVASDISFNAPIASDFVPVEENSYSVPVVLDKDAMYYWRVRAVNGLDSSDWSPIWSFRTMPPVGIDEENLAGLLTIYPNPAENTVYIAIKEKQTLSLHLTITDLMGKTVAEKNITFDSGNINRSIDVSSLRNGIYMVRLSDNERIYTKKLIIKR